MYVCNDMWLQICDYKLLNCFSKQCLTTKNIKKIINSSCLYDSNTKNSTFHYNDSIEFLSQNPL